MSASLLFAYAASFVSHASVRVPEGTAHTPTETLAEHEAKMGWWRDARFGMFIHWSLYAVPAGEWNGRRIRGIGEWILKDASIPIADYQALATRFNQRQFDAYHWGVIAKNAGMNTSSPPSTTTASRCSAPRPTPSTSTTPHPSSAPPPRRRLPQGRHEFGFYYSHDQDWTAPGGAVIGKTWNKAQAGRFEHYLRTKSLPQFKELPNNYPPAHDVIWFETPTTEMTPELARQSIDLIKLAHPNLIWNERLGGGFKDNYRSVLRADPVASVRGVPAYVS